MMMIVISFELPINFFFALCFRGACEDYRNIIIKFKLREQTIAHLHEDRI